MSRYHLTSTSRALYRVFVAPNLPPRFPLQSHRAPAIAPAVPLLSITCTRSKATTRRPVKRQALFDYFTFDNAIKASHIDLIDENGVFRPDVYVGEAMRRMNRVTHHLVLIGEEKLDEFGDPDPDYRPKCKVISKIELRNQHNRKIEIERRSARGLGSGPKPKNLELNWAIAGGDLKHRLEKLKGFLREGRKVEMLLGPKRRGKTATDKECSHVLKAIEDAVADCKGARAVKKEGVRGGVMTLVFEGKKIEADEEMVEKADELEAAIPKETDHQVAQ